MLQIRSVATITTILLVSCFYIDAVSGQQQKKPEKMDISSNSSLKADGDRSSKCALIIIC